MIRWSVVRVHPGPLEGSGLERRRPSCEGRCLYACLYGSPTLPLYDGIRRICIRARPRRLPRSHPFARQYGQRRLPVCRSFFE
jgi:hypothetical protein